MPIALNTNALDKLARAFGKGTTQYNGIVTAAEKSLYLAGELNAFGDSPWKMSIGAARKGVYTDPSDGVIVIASDWKEPAEKFATTLAHELGHALLQNGVGGPAAISPDDASAKGRVVEGVALASEYIVAIQLGLTGGSAGNTHSDDKNLVTPQLTDIAKSMGINVGALTYGSPDSLKLTTPTSKIVEVGGKFYGSLNPSTSPWLTYDQSWADWWIIEHCGINPRTVDWTIIKGPTITYSDTTFNGKAACLINTEKIPFLSGTGGAAATVGISGLIVPDGYLTASLFGTNGQMIEQLKYDYSGFKTQDIYFGSNGKAVQQFDFKLDKSYTRYDFAADGSQTATFYGTAGQMVEMAKFNAAGFKLVDTFFGSNGKATQQFEYKTDKSYTKYEFSADGSQTATLYGTTGQMVEMAKFNALGFKLVNTFFGSNGKPTQQFEYKTDKSYTKYDFAADGSVSATLYGTSGQMVEMAKFNASGFKTVNTIFGPNGKPTQQFEFSTDKTYTKYDFAADGSQIATLYGTTGQMVEMAKFNASGFKFVDTLFGSNGKATQQFEYKTDKSYTKYDFAADGAQTATLYGTTGQMVEMAKFTPSGFKTVDTFFGSDGKITQQFEYKIDKSYTKYNFSVDGSQTATVYGTTGAIVEYAKFNASGYKTQDIFYGANGKATKHYEFNLDKSYTLYNYFQDESQTATLFGVNGQVTEYMKFNSSGMKTQDIYFGANGKSTQIFGFNPDNSYTWYGFNADGSQRGVYFNSNGKAVKSAQFNADKVKTQDIFYNPNGTKSLQFDFSLDKSYTSHKFEGSMEYVAMFGVNNIIFDYYQFSSGKLALRDFFDNTGRVIEADRFGSDGKLSSFSKYLYNGDGSYWASDYNASGNLIAKSMYGSGGQVITNASIYSNKLGGIGFGNLVAFGQI